MSAISILQVATWTGLMTLTLGAPAALARSLIYVPLGEEIQIGGQGHQIVQSVGG